MEPWIAIALTLIISLPAGYYIRKKQGEQELESAENKAQKIIDQARTEEKEITHEAKEKTFRMIEEAKKDETARRQEVRHMQERLEKRESLFDKKISDLEIKQQQLAEKTQKLEVAKQEILDIKAQQHEKLQKIAGLSRDQAKTILMESTETEMRGELLTRIKKIQEESSETLEREAKKLLTDVILRYSNSQVVEVSTSTVALPNDEMKGRIIGKEGRNIKTIEQLTGVEILIDDTPEAITISGFNPLRRQVAKKSIEALMKDGRIHPGRIEEAVEQAKKEIAIDVKKAGEAAAYEAGVAGLDPKLLQILGRLKYRTSYAQNVLNHSVEVAHLSAMLASELGADPHIARKGGLLHDIGKALDHEVPGTHTEIGRDIAKKFNLPPEIIAPIYEHHDDHPSTPEALIVKIADAISASRPGARNISHDFYIQRLKELEDLATSFPGVDKAYAIAAGREIRVFINPDSQDDLATLKTAKDIAGKIQEELVYPGEIKVSVIREKRVIEYAR
ncbi:MAG: uncharacterized protein G01um101418_355 [Parcubacteria group bacterium Gr01-1014_18]|nr:MAG: uncharacterized protein Greene041636_269 [Parcubacteria group bacterium Greene0416_36]TSC81215.1 MAG: uncharacterized protein G01um101418_355 [Parcubacteria group bacterium Gr01-1014_18]TSC99212.1 MAG: uncharacterized protein Greene101420_357 [Parcubacteria group bacterium Greene1014_20]TSD07430.1 MAG: uncharacterized protein Greene07142_129 [Parcubacteria group bacterium Greene0714_2]